MADRLINEDAVLALIDRRIAAAQRLQTNPCAKAADKRQLEAVVNAMQRLQEETRELPAEEYTEGDKLAIIAANENELAALQEIADANGWEA